MFKLELYTGHEAFQINRYEEIARILREIASATEEITDGGKIIDRERNVIGQWSLTDAAS